MGRDGTYMVFVGMKKWRRVVVREEEKKGGGGG
jgi:hypothetical protein